MSTYEVPPSPYPRSGGTGRTCFIIGAVGCLSLTVVGVILVVILFFTFRSLIGTVVEEFTDTQPVELPQVTLTQAEMSEVRDRVERFKQALRDGVPAEPLVLSGEEITAWVQTDPAWAPLKGKIYFSIEGDNLRGQVSVPLDALKDFPMIGGKVQGRYFNGSATFDVFLTGGILYVHLVDAEVKGKTIPEEARAPLRAENLAQDLQVNQPEIAELVGKLERIEIKDGLMTLVPKAVPAPQEPAAGLGAATT